MFAGPAGARADGARAQWGGLVPGRESSANRFGGWCERLSHQSGGIEDSGTQGLDRALGVLLDGVTLRGSLPTCPEAFSLANVMASDQRPN
jgi:hypothetical protein